MAGETGSGKTTQLPKICLELGRETHRPHAAAADRRAHASPSASPRSSASSSAASSATRCASTDRVARRHPHQADDRRHPARRDPPRPRPEQVRHDHHRRGPRAQPHHRLPARLPQAAAPPPPRPQAHRHERDDRPGELRAALRRRRRHPGPHRRGERAHLPGRDPVPAAGRGAMEATRTTTSRRPSAPTATTSQGITDALDELAREAAGDVLVFLSGENEIRDAEDAIARPRAGRRAPRCVPLYGRLSAADQHRVFETKRSPGIRRRVVLATNVAETSLTVPGIKYVIDAGTARISRYSARAKVQRLPIEAISQASANQRSGRAGRTSDGIAIRLYSRGGLRAAAGVHRPGDPAHQPRRGHPADDLARARRHRRVPVPAAAGLARHQGRPRPAARARRDPTTRRRATRITTIGRDLAQLPSIRASRRMLVESKKHGVDARGRWRSSPGSASRTRASARSRSARRPTSSTPASPTRRATSSPCSTSGTTSRRSSGSCRSSAFRRMCKAEYLNYLRVREWQDVYRQLVRAWPSRSGCRSASRRSTRTASTARCSPGCFASIGLQRRRAKKDYLGARQQRFVIFPGSALAKKQPAAVMAAELVETSRLFARTVARDRPGLGGVARRRPGQAHLLRAALGEEAGLGRRLRAGDALRRADRRAKRRVQFARIDPAVGARAVHPARAGRGRLAVRIARNRALRRSTAPTARCASELARGRGAHPAPRHPGRRRGGLRLLRPPHSRRRQRRARASRAGGRRPAPRRPTCSR